MASLLTKIKPKRRWVQFSLRTALIVVTALCVALGLWFVPAARQRRAVAAIEALNGIVYYHEVTASESYRITFLRRWLPQVYFDEIEEVDFSRTRVTDADLAYLERLTSLQVLSLRNTEITGSGLAHLHELTSLQLIDLERTPVTDASLVHLQGLTNLQQLWLNGTQITDAGLIHLQGMTNLGWLYLRNTRITDAGLVHLQGLTSLQELELYESQVTVAGSAHLRRILPDCQIWGP